MIDRPDAETPTSPTGTSGVDRRRFLATGGALAGAGLASYAAPHVAQAAQRAALSPTAFSDMVWNNFRAEVRNADLTYVQPATLNGTIRVSAAGEPEGFVNISFPDGTSAKLTQTPDGGAVLELPFGTQTFTIDLLTPAGDSEMVMVNGILKPMDGLTDAFAAAVESGKAAAAMTMEARAMLALAALGTTPQWLDNVTVARNNPLTPTANDPRFFIKINWCKLAVKVAVVAFSHIVKALCAAGCSAITAGGFTVVCVLICNAAGNYLGNTVLRRELLKLWHP